MRVDCVRTRLPPADDARESEPLVHFHTGQTACDELFDDDVQRGVGSKRGRDGSGRIDDPTDDERRQPSMRAAIAR
jgi:hypothetical protein